MDANANYCKECGRRRQEGEPPLIHVVCVECQEQTIALCLMCSANPVYMVCGDCEAKKN
jgi:hypothetical protein